MSETCGGKYFEITSEKYHKKCMSTTLCSTDPEDNSNTNTALVMLESVS